MDDNGFFLVVIFLNLIWCIYLEYLGVMLYVFGILGKDFCIGVNLKCELFCRFILYFEDFYDKK